MPDAANGLTIDIDGDRLTLRGSLDAHTAVRLGEALTPLPGNGAMHLDLAGLDFMDSSGLRLIIDAHRRAIEDGRVMILENPSKVVRRLFEITGLDDYFATDES